VKINKLYEKSVIKELKDIIDQEKEAKITIKNKQRKVYDQMRLDNEHLKIEMEK